MLKEFKAFIMTGNVVEFAVAFILAGAVSLVVKGFVGDIIMPVVGHFAGGMDFKDLKIILTAAVPAVTDDSGAIIVKEVTENAIKWGAWVNTIINLIIVGFVLFMMTKAYNKTKKKEEEAAPAPSGPSQEELLAEIRDLLKK